MLLGLVSMQLQVFGHEGRRLISPAMAPVHCQVTPQWMVRLNTLCIQPPAYHQIVKVNHVPERQQ